MTERDFVIEHIRERLRRLASQQDMLTCEHMLEGADEIERLHDEAHYAKGVCDLAMKHRDIAEAEVERLRAYANHERSLGAEGPMIKLNDARHEIERLRCIIGDLLWAIGHDDEKILNETTARAKATLGPKP